MNRKKVLIFSGAGLDAESGVSTFRDKKGLWNEFKIEDVASVDGWNNDQYKVLDFYNRRRRELEFTLPNKAHFIIAELEKYFDVVNITQNVTNLLERAGCTNVTHLHGELTKVKGCNNSNNSNNIDIGYSDINIGDICQVTKSQLRPSVVFFGDILNPDDMNYAIRASTQSDVCIIVGTSMRVSPANLIPFLTKETALIYYVDPGDINFEIPNSRMSFFHHIKENATVGMEMVRDEIINKFKEI